MTITLHSYDYNDQKLDDQWHQLFMFVMVSIPVIMVTFYAYIPDRRNKDWAIREVISRL